jgi:DNA-binding CsgD family transcriptional regulator
VAVNKAESRAPAGFRFVGRAGELAGFRELVRAAGGGRGSVVLVSGDHGAGKTRLVREAAARAERDGAVALWGQGYDDEGSPPYWPWTEIITRYANRSGLEHARKLMGRDAREIASLIPALESLRIDTSREPPAHETRYRLFTAMRGFFQRVSAETPIVIVLDDLHYCDPDTLRLLEAVAVDAERSRLLIVGTYVDRRAARHPILPAIIASLAKLPWYREVAVGSLNVHDVRLLVDPHVRGRRAAPLAESIHRRTEGNALLVVEAVRHVAARLAEGEEGLSENGWEEGASHGVAMLISRRLARLAPPALEALQRAAVLGREVDLAVLATTMRTSTAEARDRLSGPLDEGLLVETGTDRYRFGHELVQRAISAGLAPARRSAIHLAAGETLEALRASGRAADAARLAWHFANAGTEHAVKASRYAREAGQRALDAAAYDTALRHFEDASACTELLPPAERAGLAMLRAWALFALTRFFEVVPCLVEAFDLYVSAGEFERAVEAAELAAYPQGADRLPREAIRDLRERALPLVPPDSRYAARLLCVLGESLSYAHADKAKSCIARSLELARGLGDRRLEARALYARAWLDYLNLQPAAIVENGAAALRIAREIGDRNLELLFGGRLATWRLYFGDRAGAEQLSRELRGPGDFRPSPWTVELQQAERSRAMQTAEWSESGRLRVEGVWVPAIGYVKSLGKPPAMLPSYRSPAEMLADIDRLPQHYIDPDRIAGRASEAAAISRALGDHSCLGEIEALARRALSLELSPQGKLRALVALGSVGALRGDLALLGEACTPEVASAPGEWILERSTYLIDSVLAWFLDLLDRSEEARTRFEGALAFCRRCGLVWNLYPTCISYASFLLRHGERRRARELADEARPLGARLKMKGFDQELAEITSRLEGALPDGLSEREAQVIALAARGLATKQIAAELDISYFTAVNHLRRIYAKTGCRSRVELAAYAMRHQLARAVVC